MFHFYPPEIIRKPLVWYRNATLDGMIQRKRTFKEKKIWKTETATNICPLKTTVPKSQKIRKSQLTYSSSKIIEKYLGNSWFLVKLQTYSLQLYLKLNFFTCMFQRFCQLLKNSYFSSFQDNVSPTKKQGSWLLLAKCVKNTGRIISHELHFYLNCHCSIFVFHLFCY